MAAPLHPNLVVLSPVESGFAGSGRWSLGRLIPLAEASEIFADDASVTLAEAVAFASDRASSAGLLAPASLKTFEHIWHGFARFARLACDMNTVADVDAVVVERFLAAPASAGRPPSAATRQLRRTALRFLFRVLRDAGLLRHDPTLDVDLPAKGNRAVRPLTTAEVERCRLAAPNTLLATREPAAWALLETGGSPAELGNVRFCDLDLDGSTVTLGHAAGREREVPLSSWAVKQLRRRTVHADATEWVLVGTPSSDHNGRRTRATELARNVMRRAGVTGPGVSARSVTAWAGWQVLDETGRIEDVAKRLGMTSLDSAAALLGYRWDDG